jgi:sugar diacid utilization regulator
VEDRLTKLLLDGASLRQIAGAVTELTGKPCSIHDPEYRRLANASPAQTEVVPPLLDPEFLVEPAVQAAVANLTPGKPSVIGPIPALGLTHRFLVTQIKVGAAVWGYLVIMEHSGRLGAQDTIVARRTATIIALELSAERRAAEGESRAVEALTRDLIEGSDQPLALGRRAAFYGVALSEPHVVCLLSVRDEPAGERLSSARVAKEVAAVAPEVRALVGSVSKGAAVILELPRAGSTIEGVRAARCVATKLVARLADDGSVIAALSTVCTAAEDYPAAYGQALELHRCIGTFGSNGRFQVIAADDLGAGRLLLAATNRTDADRFTRDTLGPILAEDAGSRDLLETLRAFFTCSRSVRRSSALLDVHENTIRYRLGRIGELTGLDVAGDSGDQLAAQLALLILQMEGRLVASQPGW